MTGDISALLARFDRLEALVLRLLPPDPEDTDQALASEIARVQGGNPFLAAELLSVAAGDDDLEAALLAARIGSSRSLGAWLGRMSGTAGVERMAEERGRVLWRVGSAGSEPAQPTRRLSGCPPKR